MDRGRRADRPELDRALAAVRLHRLPVVVAKVDLLNGRRGQRTGMLSRSWLRFVLILTLNVPTGSPRVNLLRVHPAHLGLILMRGNRCGTAIQQGLESVEARVALSTTAHIPALAACIDRGCRSAAACCELGWNPVVHHTVVGAP